MGWKWKKNPSASARIHTSKEVNFVTKIRLYTFFYKKKENHISPVILKSLLVNHLQKWIFSYRLSTDGFFLVHLCCSGTRSSPCIWAVVLWGQLFCHCLSAGNDRCDCMLICHWSCLKSYAAPVPTLTFWWSNSCSAYRMLGDPGGCYSVYNTVPFSFTCISEVWYFTENRSKPVPMTEDFSVSLGGLDVYRSSVNIIIFSISGYLLGKGCFFCLAVSLLRNICFLKLSPGNKGVEEWCSASFSASGIRNWFFSVDSF